MIFTLAFIAILATFNALAWQSQPALLGVTSPCGNTTSVGPSRIAWPGGADARQGCYLLGRPLVWQDQKGLQCEHQSPSELQQYHPRSTPPSMASTPSPRPLLSSISSQPANTRGSTTLPIATLTPVSPHWRTSRWPTSSRHSINSTPSRQEGISYEQNQTPARYRLGARTVYSHLFRSTPTNESLRESRACGVNVSPLPVRVGDGDRIQSSDRKTRAVESNSRVGNCRAPRFGVRARSPQAWPNSLHRDDAIEGIPVGMASSLPNRQRGSQLLVRLDGGEHLQSRELSVVAKATCQSAGKPRNGKTGFGSLKTTPGCSEGIKRASIDKDVPVIFFKALKRCPTITEFESEGRFLVFGLVLLVNLEEAA